MTDLYYLPFAKKKHLGSNQSDFLPVPLNFKFLFEKFKEVIFRVVALKPSAEFGEYGVLLLRLVEVPLNQEVLLLILSHGV